LSAYQVAVAATRRFRMPWMAAKMLAPR